MEVPPQPLTPQTNTLFQASVDKSSKSNIREKLIRFFLRRPTMDDLFKKGIIRNEPVFGSTLRELEANSANSSHLSSGPSNPQHLVSQACFHTVLTLPTFTRVRVIG